MNMTSDKQLIMGDIYLDLTEGDQITIDKIMPQKELLDDNYIEFTVSGKNDSDTDVIYDINVLHGDDADITGGIRVDDNYVSFTLMKLTGSDPNNDSDWTTVVDKGNYVNFSDGYRIYADKVTAGTTISHTYRLYVWINESIRIYDGGDLSTLDGDYSASDLGKLYATVKVKVTGDFKAKTYGVNFYDQIFDKDNNKGVSDTVITFSNRSGSDGKTGLYYMNSTASDDYPIYYFRGNVTTNNVVFAGYCWKMVRTTDTGGIKMIYNGEYDATNKCVHVSNTLTTTGLGNSAFNSNYKSLAYMGYSYPNQITLQDGTKRAVYEWVENDTNILSRTEVVYGADVDYDDFDGNGSKEYKLKSGTVTGKPDGTHKYSCNLTSIEGTCTLVRFYYYANLSTSETESDRRNYYINLQGGDRIDDAVRSMTEGPVDAASTIQTKINGWYDTNIKSNYGDYLEDTIWCMDRSASSVGAWSATGGLTGYYYTQPYTRASGSGGWSGSNTPKLTCDNDNDKLKYAYGHGNIGSKAALLTYDEVGLAGMTWYTNVTYSDNYLYTGYWYWLLSPAGSNYNTAIAGYVNTVGELNYYGVGNSGGVRPVVSLKHGTQVFNYGETGVDGSEAHPYIVGTNIS